MANEEKQAAGTSELDDLAFEIFKDSAASAPLNRVSERLALAAYQKAEIFLSVKKKVQSGQVKAKKQAEAKYANCCAPNLKRTHPINLVSQQMGDLEKVNRIKIWLDKNPTPESDPEELVTKINRQFPDLGWDLPQINTARNIFPAYCNN